MHVSVCGSHSTVIIAFSVTIYHIFVVFLFNISRVTHSRLFPLMQTCFNYFFTRLIDPKCIVSGKSNAHPISGFVLIGLSQVLVGIVLFLPEKASVVCIFGVVFVVVVFVTVSVVVALFGGLVGFIADLGMIWFVHLSFVVTLYSFDGTIPLGSSLTFWCFFW